MFILYLMDQLLRRITCLVHFEFNEWFGFQMTFDQGTRHEMIEPLYEDDEVVKVLTFVNSE
jgi:hypothetical protein